MKEEQVKLFARKPTYKINRKPLTKRRLRPHLLIIRTAPWLYALTILAAPLAPRFINYANVSNTGYQASDVLGQSDFTNNTDYESNRPDIQGLDTPQGTALDAINHRLFVVDSQNTRVLVYSLDSSNKLTGQDATNVIGQPDFTSYRGTASISLTEAPSEVAYDSAHNRLFVSDECRVLVFDLTNGITNGMDASYVLGQPDFNGRSCTYTVKNRFGGPVGLAYDANHDRLFVADRPNNRVLVFDFSPGISNGMDPSYVLGRPDFTSSTDAGACGDSQHSTCQPYALAYDSSADKLFVSGWAYPYVKVFDLSGGITDDMDASNILGQNNYTTQDQYGATQHTFGSFVFDSPEGLTYDSSTHSLYVADTQNNRVMVFDFSSGITDDMNASFVLGQPNFTSSSQATTQSGMNSSHGLAIDSLNHQLFMADSSNNRVLDFDFSQGISNGMNASFVLGQADYTSSSPNHHPPPTAFTGIQYPQGTVVDRVHHRLFAASCGERVLVYNLDANNNLIDHVADNVLGQPDINTDNSPSSPAANNMGCAVGPTYDPVHNRLFVADDGYDRVLVFDLSNGITNGMNATYVLGEPDFTTDNCNTDQASICDPYGGQAYDTNTNYLYVSDSRNARVLVFDLSNGITNGMNATYVVGQPTFITGSCAITQSGLSYPYGLALDQNRHELFVADDRFCINKRSARVLVYDTTNLSNGMNASFVLGQPDFITGTTSAGNPNQGNIDDPEDLAYDNVHQRLFAYDDNNNRIMVFDLSQGISNGMNAMGVLGQADFTSSDYSCNPTASSLCDSEGLSDYYDTGNNRLYVSDSSNNRVLLFNFAKLNGVNSSLAVGTPYSQTLGSQTQGTTAYAVSSGALPPGLSLDSSTGVLSGIPTSAGTYNFSVHLADDNGNAGTYTDDHSYSLVVAAVGSSGSGSTGTSGSSAKKASGTGTGGTTSAATAATTPTTETTTPTAENQTSMPSGNAGNTNAASSKPQTAAWLTVAYWAGGIVLGGALLYGLGHWLLGWGKKGGMGSIPPGPTY